MARLERFVIFCGMPGVSPLRRQRLLAIAWGVESSQKMRWNAEGKWVFSEQPAHPKIIEKEDHDGSCSDWNCATSDDMPSPIST